MSSVELYNPTDTELVTAVRDVSKEYDVAPVNQVGDVFTQSVNVTRLAGRLEELRGRGLVSKAFRFPGLTAIAGTTDGSRVQTGFIPTEAGLQTLAFPE